MTETPRRSHPFLVALALVGALTLLLVGSFLALVGFALSKAPSLLSGSVAGMGAASDKPNYLRSLPPGESVFAGIKLEGEIGSGLANVVLEKLDQASKDDRIKGVLLDVDSPGGAVVPSQEMYDAILSVKGKKPVVAYVRDVAASGAYYSIAPATAIVANRGSMVGSIGVILAAPQISELLGWAKVRTETLKTGKLKDAGSPVRPWTDDDKAYLQNLIDKTRDQFVADVKAVRALGDVALERMSDGRVVLGPEALELRLVDKLGSKDVAIATLSELAKIPTDQKRPLVRYLEDKPEGVPFFVRYLFDEGARSFGSSVAEGLRSGLSEATTGTPQRR
jgi:protease-4